MAPDDKPTAAPRRRLRRAALLAVPPLAILLLGWLGRFATNTVPTASASSSSGSIATLASDAPEGGVDAPLDDAPEADVAPEASARAIESLPDGGFVIDLNLADEADLQKLPGIGPSRARSIVALRARIGRIKSVDDLARIKGFGRALVRRLRPLVRT